MALQPAERGEVSLRHLSKSFTLNGRPLPVLKDLSLTVRPGESLAIVGANYKLLEGTAVPDVIVGDIPR